MTLSSKKSLQEEMESLIVQKRIGATPRMELWKGWNKGHRRDAFVLSNKYFFHPLKKGSALIYKLNIISVKIKVGVFGRY